MSDSLFAELKDADLEELRVNRQLGDYVQQAVERQASDLYFQAERDGMSIAIRHWGVVEPLARVDSTMGRHLVSAIKVWAKMDIAERRRPLDGRLELEIDGQEIDVRVNSLPTLFGEDVTLRLLDPGRELRSLDELGMRDADRNRIRGLLQHPSGLILVTGPTGAGKTTTLYACLDELNDGKRKINTLEDPVEYSLEGVRQSQVNSKIDLTFAQLLASVLRQAPDVVMVGEVRDHDTAATAVRAANSGHLVFATLHAPVAAGAVQSMLALGAAPHFLASSLIGIIAQRLVRTLCVHCRKRYELTDAGEVFTDIEGLLESDAPTDLFGPGGCTRCDHQGYTGRTGVFEIMTVDRGVRQLIADTRPNDEVEQAAIRGGMTEFRRAALLAIAEGRTTLEEVLRVITTDVLKLES